MVAGVLSVVASAEAQELRTWTSSSGKDSVNAVLVDHGATFATLKKVNGKLVTVAIDKLSPTDKQYVEQFGQPQAVSRKSDKTTPVERSELLATIPTRRMREPIFRKPYLDGVILTVGLDRNRPADNWQDDRRDERIVDVRQGRSEDSESQYEAARVPQPTPPPARYDAEVIRHDSTAAGNFMRGEALKMRAFGEMKANLSLADYNGQLTAERQTEAHNKVVAAAYARRAVEHTQFVQRSNVRRENELKRDRQDFEAAESLQGNSDPLANGFVWPTVLQRPEYSTQIKSIEQGVARWVAAGRVMGRNERMVIKRRIAEAESMLRSQLAFLAPEDIAAGRDVLRRVSILMDASPTMADSVSRVASLERN